MPPVTTPTWPGSFTTVPVTGTYFGLDQRALSGTVRFTMSAPQPLVNTTDQVVVMPVEVDAYLVDGRFEVDLPATDDPDVIPADFTYHVVETLVDADGEDAGGRAFDMAVPTAAGVIDLSNTTQVTPSPATETIVNSVDSRTGHVTLSDLYANLGHAHSTSIDDLSDVDTSTVVPTDQQALLYEATTGVWEPGDAGGAHSHGIDDLSDVDTTTAVPTDGQGLRYNSTGAEWAPGDFAPAAHPGDATSVHGITDTAALETQTGAQAKADTAETDANTYTDGRITVHGGGVSHRHRNTDGTWPARLTIADLDIAVETDPAAPQKPPDMAEGDLYFGPNGMEGL